MKRPGLEVRARSGYFAPSLTEMDSAQDEGRGRRRAAGDLEGAVHASSTRRTSPSVAISGSAPRPGRTASRESWLAWTPRDDGKRGRRLAPRQRPRRACVFRWTGARVTGSVRRPRRDLRLQRHTCRGRRIARRQGRHDHRGAGFRARAAVDRVAVVFRARTPLELRAIQAAPDPQPFAGRQFERTDRIILRFAVVGSPPRTPP